MDLPLHLLFWLRILFLPLNTNLPCLRRRDSTRSGSWSDFCSVGPVRLDCAHRKRTQGGREMWDSGWRAQISGLISEGSDKKHKGPFTCLLSRWQLNWELAICFNEWLYVERWSKSITIYFPVRKTLFVGFTCDVCWRVKHIVKWTFFKILSWTNYDWPD